MEIEDIKKIIDEANSIIRTNFDEEDYNEETYLDIIDQLTTSYNVLLDEYRREKDYVNENYKHRSNSDLYGIYDEDFI